MAATTAAAATTATAAISSTTTTAGSIASDFRPAVWRWSGSIAVDEHGIVADVAAAASRAAGSVGAIPVTS